MTINFLEFQVDTTSDTDLIDITGKVKEILSRHRVSRGAIILFIPGSTAALTTIEYERGVINDLARAIERMVPRDIYYEHDEAWGDGNGYSHVRAALFGPSLHIPVVDGMLSLGTWQQIVLLDFDNRPRKRRIIMEIVGE
ncbi:MAG: YjbQ family protein [Deltaproteobacteria bacterium]|nr:YjbQ family protein [Deltaproteobacteria bacterium]